MKIYNYIFILLIIKLFLILKNKLIEGRISGDINSNDQIYTHCQSNLNGQFMLVSGGGQYLHQMME